MGKDFWIRKLTSRKFWVTMIAFMTSLLLGFGMKEPSVEKIAGIVMAGASAIAYVFGEGLVDVERIKSENNKNE